MSAAAVCAAVELVVVGRVEARPELTHAGYAALKASYTDPFEVLMLWLGILSAAFLALRRIGGDPLSAANEFTSAANEGIEDFHGLPSTRVQEILAVALAAGEGFDPDLDDLPNDDDPLRHTMEVGTAFTAQVVADSPDPDTTLGHLREVLMNALCFYSTGSVAS